MLQLEGFRIIEQFGEGGVSSLYRVLRIEDELPMIAKTSGKQAGLQRMAAYLHEFKRFQACEGRGALRPYNLETANECPVLLLEDPGGLTWEQLLRLRRPTLKLPDLLRAAIALVDGLHQLHQSGIEQIGIFPRVLLIRSDLSEVRWMDLQSSRLEWEGSDGAHSRDDLDAMLPYVAPEQTGKMGRLPDYRADLYSIGVMLYQWFTESLPFQADNTPDWVYHHLASWPELVHERNRSIPIMVSEIVHKCLDKMPQSRYASAYGVRLDLEECLAQLRVSGKVQRFALASRDVPGQWLLSEGLIGRQDEQKALLQALRRTAAGDVEAIMISGQEGIGKSSLIHETFGDSPGIQAVFAAGRSEALPETSPYLIWVQVLEALTDYLLTLQQAKLDLWRERIEEAVQGGGMLLVQLAPRLRLVIGEPPPLESLPPFEMHMRIHLVMSRFIQLFPRQGEPLLLFVDDMELADEASLEFLFHLLQSPKTKHLLFIGAYRMEQGEEPSSALRLRALMNEAGRRVDRLHLSPYNTQGLHQLLEPMLRDNVDQGRELVEILYHKTAGNPLFVQQFLHSVFQQELVVLDEELRVWKWDIPRISLLDVPENQMSALLQHLHMLPESELELLGVAACIGKQFDVQMVSRIGGLSPDIVRDMLAPAVKERLLQPQGTHAGEYVFQHDQIQMSLYTRLPQADRLRMHTEIGWELFDQWNGGEEQLFRILHHLNWTAAAGMPISRRIELAELNVKGAHQAKQALAHETALTYLRLATDLLDESCWASRYELMFQAYVEKAELEFISARTDEAEAAFAVLLERAQTDLDRARIRLIKIRLETNKGNFREVIDQGAKALHDLGVSWVEKPNGAALMARLIRIGWKLRKYPPEIFGKLPPATDERVKMAMIVLTYMGGASFVLDKGSWLASTLLVLELAMDKGMTPEVSVGLAGYALLLTYRFHRFEEAYRWGRLACDLSRPYPSLHVKIFSAFTLCHESWGKYEPDFLLAFGDMAEQAALRAGELWHANHSMLIQWKYWLEYSHPLQEIYAGLLAHADLFRRNREGIHWKLTVCSVELVVSLIGTRASDDPFAGHDVSDPVFMQDADGRVEPFLEQTVHVYLYTIGYLMGDYEAAYKSLMRCLHLQRIDPGDQELVNLSDDYYYILLAKELYDSGTPEQKADYLKQIRRSIRRIRPIAKRSPELALHKLMLAQAVWAQLHRRFKEADGLYEQALERARSRGFYHDAGIIAECFARFALEGKRERLARFYLFESYDCFREWGATAKMANLEKRYGSLLELSYFRGTRLEQTDYRAVALTAQALSGEMEMERLQRMLMQIMLHHAGAAYGALILNEDERWCVKAYGSTEQLHIVSLPLGEAGSIVPLSVLEYVSRTREALVLQDASVSSMFQRDKYTRDRRIKSALCLPIFHQNQPIGLLYMENNYSTGVFTAEQLGVLKLLGSQSAISIMNARLYEGIQLLKNSLEEQVRERTLALEKSMRANSEFMAEMTVYAERNRIAQEIHDIVGHTLTSTVLQIEAGKRLLLKDQEAAIGRLKEAQDLVRHSLSEIRNSVHMLRQDQYYELKDALEQLIQSTEHSTGARIEVRIDTLPPLSPMQKKVIYHALQEGLTNGIRHGESTQFQFSLLESGSSLEFRLQDNGKGTAALTPGFGLNMMKDRVEQVQGIFSVDAKPNEGCLLSIQIPVSRTGTNHIA